jgi:hypothetical protein
MFKMKFSAKWTAIAIATLIIGLDPLAAGAAMQSEAGIVPQIKISELAGRDSVLIARADRPSKKKIKKSKSRKTRLKSKSAASRASPAEVEKFGNVYQAGSRSVPGCISNGSAGDCDRLSSSKSALNDWCGQGKTEACNMYELLSSEERYQVTSDALRKAV